MVNILLYVGVIVCLFVHLWKEILVASELWWLWTKTLYTFMCGYVFKSVGSIPKNLIAGFYIKTMFSSVRNRQSVYQNGCTFFTTIRKDRELHILTDIRCHWLWILAILIYVWWNFVVLFCNFLVTIGIQNLSYVYLLSLYLCWFRTFAQF